MKTKPIPGTTVRLTGAFLRSTGQIAGGEGTKRWQVEPCTCGLCQGDRFVAVNEPSYDGEGQRHIAIFNLEKAK